MMLHYNSWIASINDDDPIDEVQDATQRVVEQLASYVWPEHGDRACTPGEGSYRTFLVGGEKLEGEKRQPGTVSLRDAVDLFCKGVKDHFDDVHATHPWGVDKGKAPVLLWRLTPTIERHEDRFYVRARLLATYP